MRLRRFAAVPALALAAILSLSACGTASEPAPVEPTTSADPTTPATDEYPLTITHALGETIIPAKPERVATVQWANHEVPLALGVVPVGDTNPDVILAAYSGLSQDDYDTLSKIAPVVPYPDAPWSTSWRDTILFNSLGMGMGEEGKALVADIEKQITDAVATHSGLAGTSTMFLTHVDPSNLSTVKFYTSNDTRAAFFEDLGLVTPKAVAEAAAAGSFAGSVSAEQVDVFDDVELIVTYGNEELVALLEADPLLSQMLAVKNGAIVHLDGSGPMGTAANPTPLAISWVLEDYVALLADAIG